MKVGKTGLVMPKTMFWLCNSYPDFDVEGIRLQKQGENDHASMKLLDQFVTTNHMDKAYQFMKDNGYDAVKVGM
jgi:hypothetical protein